MGKNLFVAEGYSLIDEERREGGMKNRSKWNLNTLLAERSTKERNMGVKTRTGSQDGFKRAVLCTLCVSVGGDIRLNRLQNIVFHFYRNRLPEESCMVMLTILLKKLMCQLTIKSLDLFLPSDRCE